MDPRVEAMLQHFRAELRRSPAEAYRDWFRLQEELRAGGDEGAARALADDLWNELDGLSFASQEERARFLHNVAVFFGTPGPGGDLPRAREAFSRALAHFADDRPDGWRARVAHNFGTALSNLGTTPSDFDESERLFAIALAWRTADHPIARAATLHHFGVALRRRAMIEPTRAEELLARARDALGEAVALRERERLAEGRARSLLQLAFALGALAEISGDGGGAAEAAALLEVARREHERLGLEMPGDG